MKVTQAKIKTLVTKAHESSDDLFPVDQHLSMCLVTFCEFSWNSLFNCNFSR